MKMEVTKGVNLYVRDWGRGKPIVFIPGYPPSQRIFDYPMMQLARRGFRTIGIDLRGFGYSDAPWEGNDYDTWASDIAKVIKNLGLRDVTLAGFSMGAAIAAYHVTKTGDSRITKLALLAAALPAAAPGPEQKKMFDGLIASDLADHAKFAHDFVLGWFFNKAPSPEFGRWIESMGRTASLNTSVRGLEELRDRDLRAELGTITIPTRIFHGVHDKAVPLSSAEEVQKLIKGSILIRFEESGHGLFWDEKDKLVDELMKFCEEKRERLAA
jgi:non-heme chloroperoxidase